MEARTTVALVYAGARVAYGAAMLASPQRTARSWLGAGLAQGPARVAARGLGARDALLSAGMVQALRRDHDPVPWLMCLAASDLVDIGATATDRGDLPENAALATAVVAGAFCAVGLALARSYS